MSTRRFVYERDKGVCCVCRKEVPYGSFQAHHVLPRSKGGLYDPSNLRVVCRPCHIHLHKNPYLLETVKLPSEPGLYAGGTTSRTTGRWDTPMEDW